MRFCWILLFVAVTCGFVADSKSGSSRQLNAASFGDDFARSVAGWRRQGPSGLDALFAQREAMIRDMATSAGTSGQSQPDKEKSEQFAKLNRLIDAVSGQIHGSVSRLYWYTDFDEAVHAAELSGRPILSLRLLGKLNEEVSCANSRFFRAILYANREVSDFLRQNYVLHWESVRPVPVTTIDFGGGRKIVTTVTGNSLHFVLDSSGRPLDAIPGLYSPASFLQQLQLDLKLCQELKSHSGSARAEMLRQHHQVRLDQMQTAFKKLVEPVYSNPDLVPRLEAAAMIDDFRLAQIVNQQSTTPVLDQSSEALVNSLKPKNDFPQAARAARLARLKFVNEAILINRFAQGLRVAVAEDSFRNEFALHQVIHSWFLADAELDTKSLTTRIYQELFQTPLDDPWMGLVDSQVFSGLRDNGMIVEMTEPAEISGG